MCVCAVASERREEGRVFVMVEREERESSFSPRIVESKKIERKKQSQAGP